MLDLFSGIGGFSLAASWCGIETVCFVEIDPFCQKVLKKHWPGVPIISDIREVVKWYETKNNEQPTSEIYDLRVKQPENQGLSENVETVGKKHRFDPAKRQGEMGNFVPTSADMNLNGENTPPTPMAGSGCEGKIIPTIKMAQGMSGTQDTDKTLFGNGEGGYMPETILPVNGVGLSLEKQTASMPIMSKHGKISQRKGSTSTTESPSVNRATLKNILEEHIDILTAGVPCQPASCAGKRRGTGDDRWLWEETLRIISEIKPTWCILENVRGLLSLEQGMVFENLCLTLETFGYEVQPFVIPACAVDAPHRRDRIWIVGYSNRCKQGKERGNDGEMRGIQEEECQPEHGSPVSCGANCHAPDTINKRLFRRCGGSDRNVDRIQKSEQTGGEPRSAVARRYEDAPDTGIQGLQGSEPEQSLRLSGQPDRSGSNQESSWSENWLEVATRLCGVDDGLPRKVDRVNRLKALGNSIVPQVAYQIFKAITGTIEEV